MDKVVFSEREDHSCKISASRGRTLRDGSIRGSQACLRQPEMAERRKDFDCEEKKGLRKKDGRSVLRLHVFVYQEYLNFEFI
jgi:hypothetical protein